MPSKSGFASGLDRNNAMKWCYCPWKLWLQGNMTLRFSLVFAIITGLPLFMGRAQSVRGSAAQPARVHTQPKRADHVVLLPNQAVLRADPATVPAADPATVTLADGRLTVEANNSDLTQIIREVSRETGMVLEGDVKEARVYGKYGPADASSILSELLQGMGYNVMIVGGAGEGAPKHLTLSKRVGGPSPPAAPVISSMTDATERQAEPQLGPGAIPHPAPPPSDDPQVRMQQNLDRLRQMRGPQNIQGTPP